MKILIIDDDVKICEVIKLYLEKEGFEVVVAHNGMDGIAMFKNEMPDLVILDIMLPKKDGYEVCRELRKISNIPIIMLTAKGETFDKVLGLELGADDYIVKPFDPKELIARIKAVLRRTQGEVNDEKVVVYPNLTVNLTTYEVKLEDKVIDMPPKEIELLYFLASHPNKVFTREQLLDHIWGYNFVGDTRTVDVHIKRIREKIEKDKYPWKIKTVWGVGYKFEI
ncbi:DNA-binding response OmpR family regulator [Caldicellulosiruptor bescii]|jgi:DNA-binding response OmpR family regulator|uniref:Two component transcriptional regulator, winged helix family n=2 Tax=Caldicellulosiruptor bescii TaxID=31899 RepID=B9MSA0_CALBD|nr:response regulator transcription factor [Caldicellulosiruptor bescii]ACM60554.1 two component transcriptional regulator, winged helix family [Caldicellulosiruptor bescii DSM 6725]PBC87965.1 DNA-binding response OmpR family regulator [Caldicellulosiruptor bescii]PBC90897.1 DNA-binding response OmpR family regulator [Caldicellulosiruptor bescii]PBD03671.1 DNA-binding response OmpR family regulator [Caldicellulosiruptor bescii]PBD06695.1 DNA-binding response OmpR family regulator [Caldicellulo